MITSIDTLPSRYAPGVSVFISHQRNDEDIAQEVQKRLEKMRIKSFLDATDKGRAGIKSVTAWIVENLRKSTHVIVVYTNNTKKSEWVPFEIGMAYEREEGIAIFDPQHVLNKPSYLDDFPLLTNIDSLQYFASLCKDYSKAKETTLTSLDNSTNEIPHSQLGTFAKESAQIRQRTLVNESMQKQLGMPLYENTQYYSPTDFIPNYARFFIDELKTKLR